MGITFFEMCYPFNTSMERVKILCELRRPETNVPDHFRQKSFSRHVNFRQKKIHKFHFDILV
jgi:hypothetical protein